MHQKDVDPPKTSHVSGPEARQGDIVLKSQRRRLVFIGGLIGMVLLVLVAIAIA